MLEGHEAEHLEFLLDEFHKNPGYKFDAMEGQLLAAEVVKLRDAVHVLEQKAKHKAPAKKKSPAVKEAKDA